jgi:hypothetical protein
LLYFISEEAAHEFIRRYPGIELPKKAVVERTSTYFKAIMFCLLPLFNIVLFLTFLFKDDDLKERTIAKIHKQYMEINPLPKKCDKYTDGHKSIYLGHCEFCDSTTTVRCQGDINNCEMKGIRNDL